MFYLQLKDDTILLRKVINQNQLTAKKKLFYVSETSADSTRFFKKFCQKYLKIVFLVAFAIAYLNPNPSPNKNLWCFEHSKYHRIAYKNLSKNLFTF